jgi:hypothetical protein
MAARWQPSDEPEDYVDYGDEDITTTAVAPPPAGLCADGGVSAAVGSIPPELLVSHK